MGLYIGTISASKNHKESRISQVITQIAATITLHKRMLSFPDAPSLDITFLLPGKHEKAQFSGMQMGGYTKENRTLFFECAVPEPMINSTTAETYVQAIIEDVIDNAAEYFNENSVRFDRPVWEQSVAQMTKQQLSLSN